VLAGGAAICCGVLILGMALALLRPPRMGAGRAAYFLHRLSPDDLGLPYESVNFSVTYRPGEIISPSLGTPGEGWGGGSPDPRQNAPPPLPSPGIPGGGKERTIRIAAWWIEHDQPCQNCAILIHGYADAKVGGIAWAPLMRSLGFNVLAIDLRAHGESSGRFSTAGFYERHDVSEVIDQLKVQRPEQCRRIVLFGVSLGAAVAVATAALRQDLAAVVLECPYVDFPTAALNHGSQLPVPGRLFQALAVRLCEVLARCDYSQVRPVELIRQVRCPLLIVQSEDDPFVLPAEQADIAAAVAARPAGLGPASIWQVAGSYHVLAMAEQPEEYRRRMRQFLDAALNEYAAAAKESR
jgi:pimeloyl-ACP methyl ester carboxylesterase